MATNTGDSKSILNSNTFQGFLDSLMSESGNSPLSLFLENQINEEKTEISGGASVKKGKGKKKKPQKVRGNMERIKNNVLYVPAIHNGTPSKIVLGSIDPKETSLYKNMLKTKLNEEVDSLFSKMLLDNKIPIINSGNVLTEIDVVDMVDTNGAEGVVENIENGARKPHRPPRQPTRPQQHNKNIEYNNASDCEVEGGVRPHRKPKGGSK